MDIAEQMEYVRITGTAGIRTIEELKERIVRLIKWNGDELGAATKMKSLNSRYGMPAVRLATNIREVLLMAMKDGSLEMRPLGRSTVYLHTDMLRMIADTTPDKSAQLVIIADMVNRAE